MVITAAAGGTFPAYNLRPGGSFHAGRHTFNAFPYLLHHSGEFVPLYNRIRRKGMQAMVHVNIRATYPDALDMQQDFTRPGTGFGYIP